MQEKQNELILENQKLVNFLLHKYYPKFAYDEDMISCGMIGLCKAADSFDETKSKFSSYASRCIMNEFKMEFRRRKKYNDVISLESTVFDDGENKTTTLGDMIVGQPDVDFTDSEGFYNSLTNLEKKVFELTKRGFKTVEIGDKLNISQPHAWRIQNKIKKKASKFI